MIYRWLDKMDAFIETDLFLSIEAGILVLGIIFMIGIWIKDKWHGGKEA